MLITDIIPNPNNPRIIKDDKFKKLVQSIKDFPEMLELRPIVIDENNMVLGGNMRLKACIELGLKDVPTIQAKDLTPEQKNEFIIKDNVGFGEWEWDTLANEWNIEDLSNWGVDLPLDFGLPLEAKEDDYVIPDEIETDIVLGDLFEIGEHRLLCGDSRNSNELATLMNSQLSDMIITDPPYNVKIAKLGSQTRFNKNLGKNVKAKNGIGQIHGEFQQASGEMSPEEFISFLKDAFANNIQYSKNGSIHYVFMDWRHMNEILEAGKLYTELKNLIVWNKDNAGMGSFYRSKHELCFIFKNGTEKHINTFMLGENGRYRTNVWDYPTITSFAGEIDKSKMHPTVKPVKMFADAILDCSLDNNIILDLFIGSGTTMVASHQTNRRCYGMELSPKYCQVIVNRMIALDPTIQIKKNGQPYQPN